MKIHVKNADSNPKKRLIVSKDTGYVSVFFI